MAGHSGHAKLGDRISVLVTKTIVATQNRLLSVKHRLAMAIFHSISDVISEEVHDTLGPFMRDLHEAYGQDGKASPLLHFMATQRGQLQALAGTSTLSQGLLWPVSAILNNELSPVVYETVATNPHSIPDPGSIAAMGAKGFIDDPSYHDGMAKNGLNNAWADALKQLNQVYPDAGSALDLLRRGVITRDVYIQWQIHNGLPGGVAEAMATLVDVPLSPPDAALAELRGNISHDTGVKAAAAWGVNADTYETLINNTGEPLALMQLLEAFRRGFINEDRLVKGILQSRVRDEWIDVAKQLRYAPMSTADAVNGVVQNHITQDQGASIADQNGLEPGQFATLIDTAGEPLSRTEMEYLYNRGLATEDEVKQALRESRLKNKYVDKAFLLHEKLITARELGEAVRNGAVDIQSAVQRAMEEGYGKEDATILVMTAMNSRLESQRMRIVTAIEQLYENNAMTADDAHNMVTKLGFGDEETTLIFTAAEFRRQEKLIGGAISLVKSKYIGHHTQKADASAQLDALGVPSSNRDAMLAIWTIEAQANVRLLTPAQIVKAVTNGLIQQDDGLGRLTNLGYTPDDAKLLLDGA